MTQYMQTVWTTNEGLPSDNLMDIVQDANGFIWIGSYEGLIRFDGVEFKVLSKYTHPDFNSTSARILYFDNQDNLWIGTNGDGIAKYSKGKFITYTTQNGLPDNSIRRIFKDSDETLWVGTTAGLAKLLKGSQQFQRVTQFENSMIELVFQDHSGAIWVGPGDGGVFKFENGRFISPPPLQALSKSVLLSMLQDREGNIWLGTKDHGLFILREGNLTRFDDRDGIKAKTINSLWLGKKGSVWIGSDSGLFRYYADSFAGYAEIQGFNNNLITKLIEDKEGNLWISTARGGLTKLSDSKFLTYSIPEGMVHNKVNSVIEDHSGVFWIGTDAGLSLLKDGSFIKSDLTAKFVGIRIRHINIDQEGTIWLATYSKMGTLAYKDGEFTSYSTKDGLSSNRCRVSLVDSRGNIWIGTSRGLNRISQGKVTVFTRTNGLVNDYIMTIFEDSSNKIWIGTDGGGIAVYENGSFKPFTTDDGLAANIVFKIFQDSRQTMWITTNGGISRFINGKFDNFTVEEGLKADAIFQAIEDDHGQLWMTANTGVFNASLQDLYDFAEGNLKTINTVLYDTTDGLRASITPTSWGVKAKDGRLFLPTMDGIVIVDPQQIPINPFPPPIYLDLVQIDDNFIDPAELKELLPENKRINFKFTALSYVVPEKVKFQYMLKGFEDSWSEPTFKREASYTSLPAGGYDFLIRAANNDRVWSESNSYVQFTQKPYFYETIWFLLTVATCLGLILILAYYVRVRTLRNRQIELERLLSERTKDLEIEKENYRGIVEDQTELICRFGPLYQLSFVNESFCRFFGKRRNELLESNLMTLMPPEEQPKVETVIASLNSNRQSSTMETLTYQADGATRWVQWTARILLDSHKQLIEYQAVGRDITERVEMESQLIEAKETAEAANQAKSDFIADISHEIRTPIHTILGYTNLGIKRINKLTNDSMVSYLNQIKESGKRLVNLINDLLDLSKLETGKTVYTFKPNPLSKTIDEVIAQFKGLAADKNLTIDFINPNLMDTVIMDKDKIYQVLTNLISNAIKFSNPDGKIEICLTNLEDKFQVSVTDKGMGIPEEELEAIFNKFVQSSKTTADLGGTGLGLSISKRIILDHKGLIWAENNQNGGATISFTLPIRHYP